MNLLHVLGELQDRPDGGPNVLDADILAMLFKDAASVMFLKPIERLPNSER